MRQIKERLGVLVAFSLIKGVASDQRLLWGYPDGSLRVLSTDQDKLLSTHEALHDNGPIQCAAVSRDGTFIATGGSDGVVCIWRSTEGGGRTPRQQLQLLRRLCAHTQAVTALAMSQQWGLVVTGSSDHSVILWDLNSLDFVRQLPRMPSRVSVVHVNDTTGDIVVGAGTMLTIWSLNGDCLAAINTSHSLLEAITCVTTPSISDWMETGWCITGHRSGSIKIWCMDWCAPATVASKKPDAPLLAASASIEHKLRLGLAGTDARFVRASTIAAPSSGAGASAAEGLKEAEKSRSGSGAEASGKDAGRDGAEGSKAEEGGGAESQDGAREGEGEEASSEGGPEGEQVPPAPPPPPPPRKRHPGTYVSRLKPLWQLILCKELSGHKEAVTALFLFPNLSQLYSGDLAGNIICWAIPEEESNSILHHDSQVRTAPPCHHSPHSPR